MWIRNPAYEQDRATQSLVAVYKIDELADENTNDGGYRCVEPSSWETTKDGMLRGYLDARCTDTLRPFTEDERKQHKAFINGRVYNNAGTFVGFKQDAFPDDMIVPADIIPGFIGYMYEHDFYEKY